MDNVRTIPDLNCIIEHSKYGVDTVDKNERNWKIYSVYGVLWHKTVT